MTDEEALLHAILDVPDSDAACLAYADLLEEHGQPERAEFIRVQRELARVARADARREVLHARSRELRLGHVEDWVEHCGLPMTWENVLVLFRRRLAETTAWCRQGQGQFRTSALQPPHLGWESLGGPTRTTSERQAIVNCLANARARLLTEQGNTRTKPAIDLAGGRLLLFFPDWAIPCGAAEAASEGFFDLDNVPAWDTWVYFSDDSHQQADSLGGPPCLVCWVPAPAVGLVDDGIKFTPVENIRWADDVDRTITRKLREAGLLR